jgi:hypothetical protein
MTNSTIFEELVSRVSAKQRAEFRARYRALTQLPAANIGLQQFLDDYLLHVVQLYAATAGAIWFRSPESDTLAAKSRINYDRLGLDGEFTDPHERLLRFAMSKSKSFLVKPFSAPEKQAAVNNPTDSFIVFGPVDHLGERFAVVELFLGPTPVRGKTAAERNRYLLWLDHLLVFFCRGIEARLLKNSAPLPPAMEQLAAVALAATEVQATIRITLEQKLATFAGWNFGSLSGNQTFTARVQELLDQFGFRVACPQCGSPAILRCQNTGNSKSGVFLYDHTLDNGRTFHGGPTSFPKLNLVPRPARRRRNGG